MRKILIPTESKVSNVLFILKLLKTAQQVLQ